MFLRAASACVLGCTILAGSQPAIATDRGPSTPEERKQALAIIHRFQGDPFNPEVQPQIQWVAQWTRDVPDIRLDLCMSFYKLDGAKKADGAALFNAMLLAQTAFVLENPEHQDDGLAQVQAGVQGMLNFYALLLKTNPSDRQPYLDKLIKQRNAGTLAQFVKAHLPSACDN
jgi:hypothetical protein